MPASIASVDDEAHRRCCTCADDCFYSHEVEQRDACDNSENLQERVQTLPPGEAFRVRGLLFARSPMANAFGSYRVEWDGGEGVDAEVGVLGLSSDGAPVRDYRPEEDQE